MIGEDIVITILGVDRDQVKVGIKAPQEVRILREEVYLAVVEQREIAKRFEKGENTEHLGELRKFLMTEMEDEEAQTTEEAPTEQSE